jgi:hypothetical protein
MLLELAADHVLGTHCAHERLRDLWESDRIQGIHVPVLRGKPIGGELPRFETPGGTRGDQARHAHSR